MNSKASRASLCRRVIKERQQEVQPLSMIIPSIVLAGVPVMAGPAHPLDSCLDCNLSAFMRIIKIEPAPGKPRYIITFYSAKIHIQFISAAIPLKLFDYCFPPERNPQYTGMDTRHTQHNALHFSPSHIFS